MENKQNQIMAIEPATNGKALTQKEHFRYLAAEVRKILVNGEVDFYRTAWALNTMLKYKLYESEGFKSFTECVQKSFGFSKGYASDACLLAEVAMTCNDGVLDIIKDSDGKTFKSTALLTMCRYFNGKKNADGTKRTAEEVRADVIKFIEDYNILNGFTIAVIKDRLKSTEAVTEDDEVVYEDPAEDTEEVTEEVTEKESVKVEEIEGNAEALVKWFRNYLKNNPQVNIDGVYRLICKN